MTLKSLLALCSVLIFGLGGLAAQTAGWHWASAAGGAEIDLGYAIAADGIGNQYVAGTFKGTAVFGSTPLTSGGGNDIFVAKLDPAGNWLWAKRAGGLGSDNGYGIALDANANVYLTGAFTGTAGFGSFSLVSSGSSDAFIAKLDNEGNWLWAVKAGGSGIDRGNALAVAGNDHVYLTGCFNGTAVFGGTSLTSAGSYDIFAAKLDINGNWLWAVKAGAGGADWGLGIALDVSANAYLTGYIYDSANFGTIALTGFGLWDIFAAKLDPAGNWLWASGAGGASADMSYGIALDSIGNVYLGGYFGLTALFGSTSLTSLGSEEIFAAKLDNLGNWLWARQAGGTSNERCFGLDVDLNDSAVITGSFRETAQFGALSLTSLGAEDVFVAKLDPLGNWLWAGRAGGADPAVGVGIAADPNGDICLTGYLQGTADFGSISVTSNGSQDAFVARLDASGVNIADDSVPPGHCQSVLHGAYPNPFRTGGTTRLEAHIVRGETGKLSIFNLRGQLVACHELSSGDQHIVLGSEGLSSGIYFYRLETPSLSTTRKLILLP
ncbi:MAG: T9SS type A sorting domain-containing protein [Candidatus Cloacimonadaceae bacterium]